jgi:hypothetical protein
MWQYWSSYYGKYLIDAYTYVYTDSYRNNLEEVHISYHLWERPDNYIDEN